MEQQHVISGWLLRAFARGGRDRETLAVYDKITGRLDTTPLEDFMVELVLQRRLMWPRMFPQPALPVAGPGGGLPPLLVLIPGDRGGGAPAFDRQHDLKQLTDLRHGCEGPIFFPTRAGPP